MRLSLLLRLSLVSASITAGVAAIPASAQEPGSVSGVVVDRGTGEPVAGALVEVPGATPARVVTDAEGRFAVRGLAAGAHTAAISRVGYQARTETWRLEAGTLEVRVALEPAAVELEGITAWLNRYERRLESRRRAAGTSVRAYGQEAIARTVSPDAWDFVKWHSGLAVVACPRTRGSTSDLECVWKRGRAVRVAVYIDEVFSPFGMAELHRIPRDQIHLVEVYDGTVVRVYSKRYVQRAAERNLIPM